MKHLSLTALAIAVARLSFAADGPAVPSKSELKEAASYIMSCDCGNSAVSPVFQQRAKLLRDAGAAVVPVLIELVADKNQSSHFVSTAASCMTTFPYSEEFRAALRIRRDTVDLANDPGSIFGIIDYFAKFGDRNDLVWVEYALNRVDSYRRSFAAKSVQQFRERLSRQ